MTENPFSSPEYANTSEPHRVVDSAEKTYQIAKSQRSLNIGIAVYLLLLVFRMLLRGQAPTMDAATLSIASLVMVIVGIGVLVFVLASLFSLARKLHNLAAAIVFTIVGLIPLIGLFAFFGVSHTATKYLRERGYEVGLMGANLSQFERA